MQECLYVGKNMGEHPWGCRIWTPAVSVRNEIDVYDKREEKTDCLDAIEEKCYVG